MSRLSFSIFIGLLLAVFTFDIRAQDKPTKSTLTNLGIEVLDREHPRTFPVSASEGGYFEIGAPPTRPGWKAPGESAPLTRVRVRSIQESEGVRIKIGGVFDDSQPVNAPGPKYGEKEEIIASYFARLGDKITVSELETFGVEAMGLRIVEYKPPPAAEPTQTILPEVVNELTSVGFIDLQSEEPGVYRLTLQNLAAKNIVALSVHIPPGNTQSTEGSREKPLMTPGTTFRTSISVSGGVVPENLRATLVIQTVLFDDGSYEGDVVIAAEMASRARGRQIQLGRLLQELQDALAKPDQETSSIIQNLKTRVARFRIDVDASVVDNLQRQFPALPKRNDRLWLASTLMDGLKSARGYALHQLKDFEEKRALNQERSDLRQSLLALRERIAKLADNQ